MVQKVRNRLIQAVQDSGETAEACFSRFDGNASGQLELDEVQKTFRHKLKIPIYAVSDTEILSLCTMLDKDGSSSVGIDELVSFIKDDGERAQSAGVKLERIKMVKSTSKWVPKPTVALIEKVRGKLRKATQNISSDQSL